MKRQASRETLERLAEACASHRELIAGKPIVAEYADSVLGRALSIMDRAIAVYRSETAPLRSRADVDAEIVKYVREAARAHHLQANVEAERIYALCREETAPEAERCRRRYPLDPNTAEDPCEDCGRDQRKHEIG